MALKVILNYNHIMIYTSRIQKAIRLSTKTHEIDQKQKRKGKDIPYITHPLTVGLILARTGATEDLVIAGILHDTIEDSTPENKVTKEMITDIFGQNVSDLVLSVTEQNKSLSWEERKSEALEHIKTFSRESLLLKSADIIANTSEIIDDHEKEGEQTFERFNATKEKILQNYLLTITAIIKNWSESPLADDLRYVARKLQSIGSFMSQYPAKMIEYSDYNEDMPINCSVCNWEGTPKSSNWIDTDSHDGLSVSCPNCEKMLLVASYPLIKS